MSRQQPTGNGQRGWGTTDDRDDEPQAWGRRTTGDQGRSEQRQHHNHHPTLPTDDPAPATNPASNCSQGGLRVLAGGDDRHHTDTDSRPNEQRRRTMQGPGPGPHDNGHRHPHNDNERRQHRHRHPTMTTGDPASKDDERRQYRTTAMDRTQNDRAPAPSLACNCSRGGSRVLLADDERLPPASPPPSRGFHFFSYVLSYVVVLLDYIIKICS
jgi:hypothetical protein